MPITRTKVTPYEKSIICDGLHKLFPIENPSSHVEALKNLLRYAEDRAYEAGKKDAQLAMKKAIGF